MHSPEFITVVLRASEILCRHVAQTSDLIHVMATVDERSQPHDNTEQESFGGVRPNECAVKGDNILVQVACSIRGILFRWSVFFCHCDSEGKYRHGSPFRVFSGIFCSYFAKKKKRKRKKYHFAFGEV